MFCKKCGTEQKDGQKFCPKCGEPFFDENGKPYLKGIKKGLQDAKDKLASKADELTQQGKKLVEEKVQPQLNEKIEVVKNVDWEEKKTKSISMMQSFFSDTNKLRKATSIIAVIAVLWFFIFNHGFSASWTWWLFAIAFVVAAFYKGKAKDKLDELKKSRWSLGLAVLFGLVFIFHSPSGSSSLGKSGPREICITLQAETERATGPQERMRNLISSSGNYGFNYDEGHFYSDEIIVPSGKSWTYKDYEVRYNGGEGTVPDVRHYFMGYANERYKTYNCRNDSRNIPIFRGNDKIKIIVDRWNEGSPKTMDVKVYFVEKDDDLQVSN